MRHAKRQKQSEETKLTSEPDSDTALSDQEFETTMINTLRAVMEKVDNIQEQIVNVSREMEILRNFHSNDN